MIQSIKKFNCVVLPGWTQGLCFILILMASKLFASEFVALNRESKKVVARCAEVSATEFDSVVQDFLKLAEQKVKFSSKEEILESLDRGDSSIILINSLQPNLLKDKIETYIFFEDCANHHRKLIQNLKENSSSAMKESFAQWEICSHLKFQSKDQLPLVLQRLRDCYKAKIFQPN